MLRWLTIAMTFVCLAGWSGSAMTQPATPAEQKNAAGRAAYDQGNFQLALTRFKEAFALSPLDKYLFNAAKASARTGDLEGGIYFYRAYLKANPVAGDSDKVEADIERLKKQLVEEGRFEVQLGAEPEGVVVAPNIGRKTEVVTLPASLFLKPGTYLVRFSKDKYRPVELPVTVTAKAGKVPNVHAKLKKTEGHGWLQIDCNKTGAKVFIQGTFVGHTPLPVQVVREGSYRVRVAKPGYTTSDQMVTVATGENKTVEVTLVEATAAVEDPEKKKDPEVVSDPFPWRTTALVTALISGAITATGGGLYLWGAGQMEDADADYGPKDGMDAYQEYLRTYNDGRDKVLIGSWIFYSGLAVTTCATVAYLWLPEPQRKKGAPLVFHPIPDGFAFSFQGTF